MPQKYPSMDDIDAAVDAWFAERIQQPPISHNVETYNQAHAASADLKSRLRTLITGQALREPRPPAVIEPAEPAPEQGADQ